MGYLLWMIRILLRIPRPVVSRDEAVEIARRKLLADQIDYEKLVVQEGLRYWWVVVDPGWMLDPWMLVCMQTGEAAWEDVDFDGVR